MKKYIFLLLILVANKALGFQFISYENQPLPPEKISLITINQSILDFNKNVEIANTNKYKIQSLRVYLLSFTPLLFHGVYRLVKNVNNDETTAGYIIGCSIESTAGLMFLVNGIKVKDVLWSEEYDRNTAIKNCIELYNSISLVPVGNIKEIKPY